MSACSELLGRECDGACERDPQRICPHAYPRRLERGGTWFYLSFVDDSRPKGDQFVGGCYVEAPTDAASLALAELYVMERRGSFGPPEQEAVLLAAALAESHRLGINPGGEVKSLGPIPAEVMDENVPADQRNRLLTRAEVEGR